METFISLGTIIAVIAGGLSMGAFLSASNHFRPMLEHRLSSAIIMCTLGLSFIIPLAAERFVESMMGGSTFDPNFWFSSIVLWVLFSIHTVGGQRITDVWAERKRLCEECDGTHDH